MSTGRATATRRSTADDRPSSPAVALGAISLTGSSATSIAYLLGQRPIAMSNCDLQSRQSLATLCCLDVGLGFLRPPRGMQQSRNAIWLPNAALLSLSCGV
jgi:hypothetical protein